MIGVDLSVRSIEGGEKLCEAYEIYREWEPDAPLEFNQSVLLANAAMKGKGIELSTWERCGGAFLIDKGGTARWHCVRCRKPS